MQTLLQDVTGYLPLAGGLSPGMRLELKEHLLPLASPIFAIAWGFIFTSVALALKAITATVFIPFFMIVTSPIVMMLQGRKDETGTAHFELPGFKISWQGGLAFTFLVTGVLLLVLVNWTKT